MKLLYTDIRTSLTDILTREAEELVAAGKRVFYIAPNSLSFEKERAVLECLSQQASFAITVTRFTQMARYLILNDLPANTSLDDIGLGMAFYKCLAELDSKDLRVYGAIKQDPQFIQQLIELYHEMTTAQMSFLDLESLTDEDKRADLLLIFEKVTAYLNQGQLAQGSQLSHLIEAIENGKVSSDFSQIALVIDGFTRFSAEEERVVDLLHRKGAEIVIGAYASKKAYTSPFSEGNLYQASVEFLHHLGAKYQTPAQDRSQIHEKMDCFDKASRLLESSYDFSELALDVDEKDRENLQIWSCLMQKEELELVARAIRQKLHDNPDLSYKNFRILLGDVSSYQLSLKTIFDQYQIPFYLGRSESMAHHPLTQYVESILRLKRYRFRQEDLINLLRTGLYTDLSQADIDAFEQYLRYLGINGLPAFQQTFTKSHHGKFDLERLNALRLRVLAPLETLFASRKQKTENLLKKWNTFLKNAALSKQMQELTATMETLEQERQAEVWKAFCHVLEQFATVFAGSQVSLEDFLSLLHSGMSLSQYRTIPATVDTVLVQSYDLIAPMTADFVYAIGLTQDHLPKIAQNTSLLTDEERQSLNQATEEGAQLLIASSENLKKNRYTMLSLVNAARKQLILSAPSLLNENESKESAYLQELVGFGFSRLEKKIHQKSLSKDDMGSYHSLLSSLVSYHQQAGSSENEEDVTFVKVLARVMGKKLDQKGLTNPALPTSPSSKPLEKETLKALYPADKEFYLSTSGLTEFYRNEYSYFLRYVLGLQEELLLRPDARSHGNFLHRIFERALKLPAENPFDQRLEQAIKETSQEREFEAIYQESLEAQFTKEVLLDVARTTGHILRHNPAIETIQEEATFGGKDQAFIQLDNGRSVHVRGKVDRIDRLKADGALGVVDYKSSLTQFQFPNFFNGLNSQLPTYLAALKGEGEQNFFGAMYLEMAEPVQSLLTVKSLDGAVVEASKSMKYQGLFLEKESSHLGEFYNKNKANQLTDEEFQLLLDYNAHLYKKAAEKILEGQFAINPYTENGRSIAPYVQQHQAITGFEANYHLGQARFLEKLELADGKRLVGEKLKQAWFEKMREELNR
ncbi:ATP-dependent nuclease subunit B [Streptococcus oralis subsp. oralis]|uniref:ATP-dependent nuclease subunit B n=1 Tax=Streptococcus oralis TaxID=1303 RepID=UPI000A10D236|nr:ATP-dependent nuclease subunit B [Streptococcus oralis]ORO53336.1 ATP-dependent nuclease subunit B [Streptococcus oralis subsp. oralis]